ncbi:hypothetical protein [Leptospira kmetyi]|uniref:Uncharacterized protein n=2 Tax=Leptospira kmetyi TaxID=408139 RepID=A0ABX4N774_9LEPT|nr:hypothetical protein [Leptospira kmetyi]PJZ28771.1 hypothetical protein CH378_16360 [Leptospira kmetyi]
MGVDASVYAMKSKSRFGVHREYNLISWRMFDEKNFVERLRNIHIGLSRAEMLEFLDYSIKWGFGPNNEVLKRDLEIVEKLLKWVNGKLQDEIFYECPDFEAEEFPSPGFSPDDFVNETEW